MDQYRQPLVEDGDEEGAKKGHDFSHREYSILKPFKEMHSFGVGVVLFFKYLVFVALLYLLLFILNTPTLLLNLQANQNTTIAQEWTASTALASPPTVIHASLDLAQCVLFLAGVVFLARSQTKTTDEIRSNQHTPGEFTVVAYGLPIDVTNDEVYEHFAAYGQIIQVIVVDEAPSVLSALAERKEIMTEIWEYRLIKREAAPEQAPGCFTKFVQNFGYWRNRGWYERRLLQLDARINKLDDAAWYGHPAAVVTFKTVLGAATCVRDHSGATGFQQFVRCIFPCCAKAPPIRGDRLHVVHAPEPSDMLWENLGYDRGSRAMRTLVVATISAVMIFGVGAGLTEFQFWQDAEESKEQSLPTSRTRLELIAYSVVIFIVNQLLSWLLQASAKWEKPQSKSSLNKALITKSFIWQYINSIQVALVWSQQNNFRLASPSESWAKAVGGVINTTLVTDLIITFILSFIVPVVLTCCSRRKAGSATTERERQKILQGPEMGVSAIYASILKTQFVAITLCAGLPYVTLICAVKAFMLYWTEKTKLLRVYNRPPLYDDQLGRRIEAILPWGVLLHAAFTFFLYYQKGTTVYIIAITSAVLAGVFFGPWELRGIVKWCSDEYDEGAGVPSYDRLPVMEAYRLPSKEDSPVSNNRRGGNTESYLPPVAEPTYVPMDPEEVARRIKEEKRQREMGNVDYDGFSEKPVNVDTVPEAANNPYRQKEGPGSVDLSFLDDITGATAKPAAKPKAAKAVQNSTAGKKGQDDFGVNKGNRNSQRATAKEGSLDSFLDDL